MFKKIIIIIKNVIFSLFIFSSHLIYNIIKFDKYRDLEINSQIIKLNKYYKICNKHILINKKKFKKISNPKISIISPIYNCEKFLKRFIISIQNNFFDEIEIIIVDDNSKENSFKLIKENIKNDERIRLLKLKKNKGTLICRNIGVLTFWKVVYLQKIS